MTTDLPSRRPMSFSLIGIRWRLPRHGISNKISNVERT
jgi:hypothetical protein